MPLCRLGMTDGSWSRQNKIPFTRRSAQVPSRQIRFKQVPSTVHKPLGHTSRAVSDTEESGDEDRNESFPVDHRCHQGTFSAQHPVHWSLQLGKCTWTIQDR